MPRNLLLQERLPLISLLAMPISKRKIENDDYDVRKLSLKSNLVSC
jgi:hypothetical protein